MNAAIYFTLTTYVIAIVVGTQKFRQLSIFGHLSLGFLLISFVSEILNYYFSLRRESTLVIYNLYEYIAFPIEISIVVSSKVIKKNAIKFLLGLAIVFLSSHFLYNYRHGFNSVFSVLTFAHCLIISIISSCTIFIILYNPNLNFEIHKHKLLILFGIFIFEACCLVPVLNSSSCFNEFDKIILGNLYFYTILLGTIAKNALFILYFINQKSKYPAQIKIGHE
jgi:hypothetical protein